MTYPIADFLIQIKNGYLARKREIVVSHSKFKEALAKLLSSKGYLGKIETVKEKTRQKIKAQLLYENKKAKMIDLEIVSRPGRKVYLAANKLPRVLGGLGIAVISTPEGVLTDKEARKKRVGGEVICKIW